MIYSVAELLVQCQFNCEKMISRSRQFIYDYNDESNCSFEISERELEDRMLKYSYMAHEQNEVVSSAQLFFEKALEHKRLLLHAVAIAIDGEAFLFFAPPSGGKTTMANHWKKLLGEQVIVIADDSPVIGCDHHETYVWNSCWSKVTEEVTPKRYILKGIVFVYKSLINSNVLIEADKAINEIIKGFPECFAYCETVEKILYSSLMGKRCWKCYYDGTFESAKEIIDIMVG